MLGRGVEGVDHDGLLKRQRPARSAGRAGDGWRGERDGFRRPAPGRHSAAITAGSSDSSSPVLSSSSARKAGSASVSSAVSPSVVSAGSLSGDAQRLGQPAGAVEQPFGLLRHLRLLQMVDELRRLLALRLAHRLEDAGLGAPGRDSCRPSAASRPRPCRDPTARASRSAWASRRWTPWTRRPAAVAVALLVERIDAERDAMREQRGRLVVVEDGEPVPELGLVLRQLGLPGLVPLRDRLGGRAVLQVRRLDREERRWWTDASRQLPDDAVLRRCRGRACAAAPSSRRAGCSPARPAAPASGARSARSPADPGAA